LRTVETHLERITAMHMLFDPGHALDERILREQFGVWQHTPLPRGNIGNYRQLCT